MNYTILAPSAVQSGKYARRLLENALELGLKPSPRPVRADNLRKLSLYLPGNLTAQIDAHQSSLSRSDLIRGLVSAALENRNAPTFRSSPASIPLRQSRKWNQERTQEEIVGTLLKGIRGKLITLLEGSTGIGKSRIIAKAA